jgi:hypothetical protein
MISESTMIRKFPDDGNGVALVTTMEVVELLTAPFRVVVAELVYFSLIGPQLAISPVR